MSDIREELMPSEFQGFNNVCHVPETEDREHWYNHMMTGVEQNMKMHVHTMAMGVLGSCKVQASKLLDAKDEVIEGYKNGYLNSKALVERYKKDLDEKNRLIISLTADIMKLKDNEVHEL